MNEIRRRPSVLASLPLKEENAFEGRFVHALCYHLAYREEGEEGKYGPEAKRLVASSLCLSCLPIWTKTITHTHTHMPHHTTHTHTPATSRRQIGALDRTAAMPLCMKRNFCMPTTFLHMPVPVYLKKKKRKSSGATTPLPVMPIVPLYGLIEGHRRKLPSSRRLPPAIEGRFYHISAAFCNKARNI